ncbi:MAG: hypothetical protein ACI9EW_001911 [Cellvibrionaceae bacterium]|jgi:hypothetical protein
MEETLTTILIAFMGGMITAFILVQMFQGRRL